MTEQQQQELQAGRPEAIEQSEEAATEQQHDPTVRYDCATTDRGHQPVYFAVTNINIDECTIGSVDIWRCGLCKKLFCEEKQLGIEAIADVVGMPKILAGEKWGVVVCRLQKSRDKWRLVRMPEDGILKHVCIEERVVDLGVSHYKVCDDQHWSFLVEDHMNAAVEI